MSDDMEEALRALEPFAKAFEEFGRWRYTDHEKKDEWFAFQDKNMVTPTMTMGDFRKAADIFARLTASKEAPAFITYDSERDWPEDAEHENGNYMCICHRCKNNFVGHKRRVVCKKCASPVVPVSRYSQDAEGAEFLEDHPLPWSVKAPDFDDLLKRLDGLERFALPHLPQIAYVLDGQVKTIVSQWIADQRRK